MNPDHITWLYIPSAILLGALHGLEPGHSKTMMAAFIIAIRGTFSQAILLGVSAAISHSLIIWVLASLALFFGNQWNAEAVEPYLQLFTATVILAMAIWMYRRTARDIREAHHHHHHHHHDHAHDEAVLLDTGHEKIELSIFEDGVPPVFRLKGHSGKKPPGVASVSLETQRSDGAKQKFTFISKGDYLESQETIAEPHEFGVVFTLSHGNHGHTVRAEFREEDGAHHHEENEEGDYEDAHQREHAEEIRRRFDGQNVTTTQIALFGISGGLMPCPAAFSVLLICLHLKQFTLGFAMVASFSIGLALTMVTVGLLAAWSVRHAERRFAGFGEAMRRAPYISCALLVVIAAYMAWHGWHGLAAHS